MRYLVVFALALAVAPSWAAQRALERPGAQADAVSAGDMASATRRLARALHAAMLRNGTLAEARAAHEANPVGGGEVLGFQLMLADCLRVQRGAYDRLLAAAGRVPVAPAGFARRQLVMDLLDRMVAFRKANLKLGRMGDATLPSPALPRLMDALDRTLAEMDRRVIELRTLIEAAL